MAELGNKLNIQRDGSSEIIHITLYDNINDCDGKALKIELDNGIIGYAALTVAVDEYNSPLMFHSDSDNKDYFIMKDAIIKLNDLEYQMSFLYRDTYKTDETFPSQRFGTKDLTTMASMFYNCLNVNTLRFSSTNFNTSKVKDMTLMFSHCSENYLSDDRELSLVLDISGWNVESLNKTDKMFAYAAIKKLNLDNWNSSNLTSANRMFYFASFREISMDGMDVSALKDMSYMFSYVNSEQHNRNNNLIVDLSKWKIKETPGSANIDMTEMFSYAYVYPQFPKNFGRGVTNMSKMFYALEIPDDSREFNLTEWDVSAVENMSYMFYASNLKKIDMSNLDMSSAINISGMFSGIQYLEELNINNWTLPKVEDMSHMFERTQCIYPSRINLAGLIASSDSLKNTSYMFSEAFNKTDEYLDLHLESWKNVVNLESAAHMFHLSRIRRLYIPELFGGENADLGYMFYACEFMESINEDNNKVTIIKGISFAQMFNGCTSIKTLDNVVFDFSAIYKYNGTNDNPYAYYRMFKDIGCKDVYLINVPISDHSKMKHQYLGTGQYLIHYGVAIGADGFADWNKIITRDDLGNLQWIIVYPDGTSKVSRDNPFAGRL